MDSITLTKKEFKYLFLIIVVFIAACIETDIYLPAFPDMMLYFGISETQIQHLLTYNFVGICLAGPLYGPISDALGRKKPILTALGLFLIGSIMTLYAQNFETMLWGRILQGIGSGGCFTLGTAIIFDAFSEKKAVAALNQINAIVPFIMAAAPMLGGYLNHTYGFRSNFLAIAVCVFISFIISLGVLEETLPKNKRTYFQIKKIGGEFKLVLTSFPFWVVTIVVSLIFASYLAFLSNTALLFVLEFGIDKHWLPFFQAALLGSWLMANLIFSFLIKYCEVKKIKQMGLVLMIASCFILLCATWLTPHNPYSFTSGMMLYAFGANWINGFYFPEGMELFPDSKGVTASILTSIRLLVTAAIVALTAKLYNGTIYPIAGVVLGTMFIAIPLIMLYERKYAKQPLIVESKRYLEI